MGNKLSEFTIQELRAQGMLMGMWYDMDDHTFNSAIDDPAISRILDADTLEPWDGMIYNRFVLVRTGQIGAKDYLQYRKEMLGYEGKTGGKDSV